MKKCMFFILMIVLMMVLAGCGNNSIENTPTPKNEGETFELTDKPEEIISGDDRPITAKPERNSGLRTTDGPQVFAIYVKDGDEICEPFVFREDHPYFTEKDFIWTLDLNGQDIQLEEIVTVKSVLTIINGTIRTRGDAFLINESTLKIGNPELKNSLVTISVEDAGIENHASLCLHHLSLNVKNGTGITNYSVIENVYGDIGNVMMTIDSGIGISNEKECNLGTVQMSVNGGIGIENEVNGELYLFEYTEILVNAGTGITNQGTITDDGNWKIVVNKGTGIDNVASLQCSLDIIINDGMGFLNQTSGYYGSDEVGYTNNITMKLQKGTACLNYGKMENYYMNVWLRQGCAIDNYGILSGEEMICGSNEDIYSGTVVYNREGAILESVNICIHSAADCILMENSGKVGDSSEYGGGGIFIACGYTITSTYENPYATENPYISQNASCENVILLQNTASASLGNGSLELAMGGKSNGFYIGLNCLNDSSVSLYKYSRLTLKIDSQNAIGIIIPESGILCGNCDETAEGASCTSVYITIGQDVVSYSDYTKPYDAEAVTGNIGIKNLGTLKGCAIDYRIGCGSDNMGIDNLGTCDVIGTGIFIADGRNNIGLSNYGNYTDGSMDVYVWAGENNAGVQNHKSIILRNSAFLCVYEDPVIEKPYGSRNLTLMENHDYFQCDGSFAIGGHLNDSSLCINRGQLTVGHLEIHVTGTTGIALLNEVTGRIQILIAPSYAHENNVSIYSESNNLIGICNKGIISTENIMCVYNSGGHETTGFLANTGSSLHCRQLSVVTNPGCVGLSCYGDVFVEGDVNDEYAGMIILQCYGGSCVNCLVDHGGTIRYKEIVEVPNL